MRAVHVCAEAGEGLSVNVTRWMLVGVVELLV
jgi:hypothetical protein